jgi:ADP-ribosylglycohydrolase
MNSLTTRRGPTLTTPPADPLNTPHRNPTMQTRTSHTHPLRIDPLPIPGTPGLVGLTLCPGKQGHSHFGPYRWKRELAADVARIADWRPTLWINLMEPHELHAWGVASLPQAAARVCDYLSLPIRDAHAPGTRFAAGWARYGELVRAELARGGRVLIHCRGGLGRAATVAARVLVEHGVGHREAIRRVRECRGRGAIETQEQESWVMSLPKPVTPTPARLPVARAQPDAATRLERVRGGLMGLLVGDALGVPYEFKPPSAIPAHHDIEMTPPPGCPRTYASVPAGTWSDDGALALCLSASLLECGRLDPEDLGRRFVDWMTTGYMAVDRRVFDIGIQTGAALRRLQRGVPALDAGSTQSATNGNGSLMRVLPLALWHAGDDAALIVDAMHQSRVTHGHVRAQLCCALYCLVARRLLQGHGADDAWSFAIDTLTTWCARDRALAHELRTEILHGRYRASPTGSGYVVDTLWSARACLGAADYEGCVRAAIALGNDTDTTAAVAGGLAGVLHGAQGIPARWMRALRDGDVAEAMAARLADAPR